MNLGLAALQDAVKDAERHAMRSAMGRAPVFQFAHPTVPADDDVLDDLEDPGTTASTSSRGATMALRADSTLVAAGRTARRR